MNRNPSEVPRQIFRAYDIRGQAEGQDAPLTPELARQIGRAYAQHITPARQAVVGGDQRATTPALMQAAIDGLRDGGVDVIELGRATSPLVYWAAAQRSLETPTGGIVVTASHNPPQDNGIKLLEPGGMPLRPEAIQAIADGIAEGLPADETRGELSTWDPKPDYLRSLADAFPLSAPLTAAVDPGNGVAALTAAAALRAIGADVLAINDDPDDPAPPHAADPQHADNVAQLANFVRETGAHIGFAFDGDGDRLGLVDERGRRVAPDQVLALLAEDWLADHPAATIQVDVKTSRAVLEHIVQLGGETVFGPVGHSLGKYAMQERGIDFGGEASTHYFYRLDDPPHYSDDAVRTACRLARMAAAAPLAPRLDQIPRYPISPEVKIACPDDRKHETAASIADAARERWPVIETDGARIDIGTHAEPIRGAWCLIRASNTTSCLTVIVEARQRGAWEFARRITAGLLDDAGLDSSPLFNQPPPG